VWRVPVLFPIEWSTSDSFPSRVAIGEIMDVSPDLLHIAPHGTRLGGRQSYARRTPPAKLGAGEVLALGGESAAHLITRLAIAGERQCGNYSWSAG